MVPVTGREKIGCWPVALTSTFENQVIMTERGKLEMLSREATKEKLEMILLGRRVPIELSVEDEKFKQEHDIWLTELAEIWHELRSQITPDETIKAIIDSFVATLEVKNRQIAELQVRVSNQRAHLRAK